MADQSATSQDTELVGESLVTSADPEPAVGAFRVPRS